MIIDRSNVFEVIEKAGLKPDKDYGQNYLVEPDLCRAIVDALEINENDNVLEIGPGLGSLTHFILEKGSCTAVDIDQRMISFLKVVYQKKPLTLVNNDIRKEDVSKYSKIIGNLPYNITTELVLFLLINAKNAKKMVLMCQTEAYARFMDLAGENYGPASVLLHLLGSTKKVLSLKAGSFVPAPKCSSVVFTFTRDFSLDYETAIGTYKLAKSLFLSRRKTIQNNLNNLIKNKDKVNKLLVDLSINGQLRPENILPETYVLIFKYLKQNS